MKYLEKLRASLKQEAKKHQGERWNYAVPAAWNLYGFPHIAKLRSGEILVDPYAFYHYTLEHMLQSDIAKPLAVQTDRTWLKQASIYALNIRVHSAWDHDRDERIKTNDLYGCNEQGTFLKSMLLLPILKRMGINTIVLAQVAPLGKSEKAHDRPAKEAVRDFCAVDEALRDPLLPLSAQEQGAAFVEACHHMGMRVIIEYCPGKLARDNVYAAPHPEWFYWIDTASLPTYQAPVCPALPHNTIPHTYTLKDFYHSEALLQHIQCFRKAPEAMESGTLAAIEKQQGCTIAPSISDQINAQLPPDMDTTIFRFYEQPSVHVPKHVAADTSYMSQDTIRCDLHPGKKAQTALWKMLCQAITWQQKHLLVDGILLQKPYLLSEKLQKELVKTARRKNPAFAMLVEESVIESGITWLDKGYDAITGNSGYENGELWNGSYQSFAYRLQQSPCPVLAAAEFYDSRRIACLAEGKRLSILMHVMNHFLPNSIPFMLNGAECFEVQPLQLSEYGDQKYLYAAPKDDIRHLRQPYLDAYAFAYGNRSLHVLPSLLEPLQKLRERYVCDKQRCVPVWFHSPQDPAIGFTFLQDESALMAVANLDIHKEQHLHIHTENLLCELPFTLAEVHQIFSSEDPYTHDIQMDEFRNIPLTFAPGEVKFLLFHREPLTKPTAT